MLWDGSQVRLAGLDAAVDDTQIAGDLTIDLSGRAPRYRFDGKARDVAYKGAGALDFDGSLATEGTGVDLIANAHAEGSLRGQSIAFNPDADFRTVAACFELLPGVRWKISCLEV